MRSAPDFPLYKTAKPPASKRWLGMTSLLMLISAGGTVLFRQADSGGGEIIAAMFITASILGMLWLCRLLYYRFSAHNALKWQALINHQHSLWWQEHQRTFALKDVVLIGPAGSEHDDWIRLLKCEQPVPAKRQEASGKALRIARNFSDDVVIREQQLACSLVLQWKNQRQNPAVASPQRCYWLGTKNAWQAFLTQAKIQLPEIVLPDMPEPWKGEESLSEIAALLHSDDNGNRFLVAGCHSEPLSADGIKPAGEAAVLWFAGSDGEALVSRGEFYDSDAPESLAQVCERAQRQSGIKGAPEAAILFSHSEISELTGSGWNITQHLQDEYWGELDIIEPLVVISLAAIHAQYLEKSCGWIATDPQHTLTSGIVMPYGKG